MSGGRARAVAIQTLLAGSLLAGTTMTDAAGPTNGDVRERPGALVAGWIENASIPGTPLHFRAKLDTGADNSSIGADAISVFERDGHGRVRFTLTDDDGNRIELERPVLRRARIKRSGHSGDERIVVELPVCIGARSATVAVSLADRKGLKYRMLIGRNLLEPLNLLVDSARRYRLTDNTCPPG
ncbi:MAG: RimK/LysX family protein [Burkholderiaceae bacterium]